MKGFTPRERNGLIGLACMVMLSLSIGPLARLAGCTPESTPKPEPFDSIQNVVEADSLKAKEKQLSDSIKPDTITDSKSSQKSKSHSTPKTKNKNKKNNRKGSSSPQKSGNSKHRSLHDEPLC